MVLPCSLVDSSTVTPIAFRQNIHHEFTPQIEPFRHPWLCPLGRDWRTRRAGLACADRSEVDPHLVGSGGGNRCAQGRPLSHRQASCGWPRGSYRHIRGQSPAQADLSGRSGNAEQRQRRRRRFPAGRSQGRRHGIAPGAGIRRVRFQGMGQGLCAHAHDLGAVSGAHQGRARKPAPTQEAAAGAEGSAASWAGLLKRLSLDRGRGGITPRNGGSMLGFLFRGVIVAVGLWVASVWVRGVGIDGPSTLILAGLLLGIVNSIVRPIAIVLTLPMTIATLGLFLLVINAGMVALVAWMLPGMHIAGFWSAFWTAVIVSLVSIVGSWFIGPKGKFEVIVKRR